jgi:hypothetical protein
MDLDNPASRFHVFPPLCYLQRLITEGLDQVIILLMYLCEIENLTSLEEPADNIRMFWTLSKGQALSYLEHYIRRRLVAEDIDLPANDFIELLIRKQHKGVECIPKRAICMQSIIY